METFWILSLLVTITLAMDNLEVAFQWRQLDYEFPSEEARQQAIGSNKFIAENNLPLGLEVHKDRLFITVPRWRHGVAASLNYIKLSDPMDSPKLRPYPNWAAHDLTRPTPEIISPFRIRADACNRLWVLDTREYDILQENSTGHNILLIYDLTTDQLLRTFNISDALMHEDSFFANIAVEDHDCDNTFAYLADLSEKPGLVVYSWRNESGWRVQHNFFHFDPMMTEYNVSGVSFFWNDGLFGLALSKPDAEGYSTLYFHPMSSSSEFAVSTKYLREDVSKENYHRFRVLGDRGPRGQSGASFLDPKTDVLFYALLNLNAIACWRTTNPAYTMHSQGRVYMSNVTMVFPNDIKVDRNDTLWVLSDRLPEFLYKFLNKEEVNFRVFKAKVSDAIKGTACDSKLVVNSTISSVSEKSSVGRVGVVASFVAVSLLMAMLL